MPPSLHIGLQGTFTHLPFGLYFDLKVFLLTSQRKKHEHHVAHVAPNGFLIERDQGFSATWRNLLTGWVKDHFDVANHQEPESKPKRVPK